MLRFTIREIVLLVAEPRTEGLPPAARGDLRSRDVRGRETPPQQGVRAVFDFGTPT